MCNKNTYISNEKGTGTVISQVSILVLLCTIIAFIIFWIIFIFIFKVLVILLCGVVIFTVYFYLFLFISISALTYFISI